MHLTFHTNSEDQTITLGLSLGRTLRPGDILALDGELGSGKTRLVRGIAEGLGLDPAQVSSPTYVLVHEYTQPAGTAGTTGEASRFVETPLYHMDAYRLDGPHDLDSLGWDRIIDCFGVVVIEWAERIAAALAKEPTLARVRIETEGPTSRRLDLVAPKAWAQRPQWRSLQSLAASPERAAGLPPGWTRCPVTGQNVPPDSPTFPFANERARLADLGKWLTGAYTVARDLTEDDLTDPDLTTP
ncbi:MAG TPA: tRNA (adenosine(37)-N6)-threonylcarbamoyltransferase complex ATPase subunit type 1 TsaE [Phycisphaerales bacterium]|nr:tRNA (adenosine(37)-N6)-threonylcarbamoyltransferase complex ATPase subunit type 1 TsaE [Phycisphaerales bacterium]